MLDPFVELFRDLPFSRRLRIMLGGKMSDSEKRERASVIDTRAEVLLREVEAKAKLAEIKATQSASELAESFAASSHWW